MAREYEVFRQGVRRFAGNESGTTMIEYAFVVGLVALGGLAALSSLGDEIQDIFKGVDFKRPGAEPAPGRGDGQGTPAMKSAGG